MKPKYLILVSNFVFIILNFGCVLTQERPTDSNFHLNFENQGSCQSYFFKSKWNGKVVPDCPSNEGQLILPPTFPVGQLFLGYAPQPIHIQFLRDLIEKLSERKEPPNVVILVPRFENDEAFRIFKKYLEPPYSKFVQFLSMPANESLWTQDYMEFSMSMVNGRSNVIDLPYTGREGESIPAAIALNCKMGLFPQAGLIENVKEGFGSGDYGGNIEAFPGNLLVVGNHIGNTTAEMLEVNLSQDLIKVRTSWGEPGHVDEIFTSVPIETDDKSVCPFAVMYSSPKLGLDLLKQNGFSSKNDIITPPIPEGEDSIPVVERVDFSSCYEKIKESEEGQLKGRQQKTCSEFIKANLEYEKIISEDLEEIEQNLKKNNSCNVVKKIPMPLLFGPEKIKTNYGRNDDYSMSLNPNPVNVILIDDLIVTSQQVYKPFQDYVEKIYKELRIQPHFIEGSYVHYLRGGIHCSSNVMRMCNKK